MKRILLPMVVCALILPIMAYAAETYSYTDSNGVKHIVTITKETETTESVSSSQGTAAEPNRGESQERKAKKQPEPAPAPAKEKQGNEANSLPPDVGQQDTFQFDIDRHEIKNRK